MDTPMPLTTTIAPANKSKRGVDQNYVNCLIGSIIGVIVGMFFFYVGYKYQISGSGELMFFGVIITIVCILLTYVFGVLVHAERKRVQDENK